MKWTNKFCIITDQSRQSFQLFFLSILKKRNRFCSIWNMYILINTWMCFRQIRNKVVMIYIGINLVIKALRERKNTWEWLFYTIVLVPGDFTFHKRRFFFCMFSIYLCLNKQYTTMWTTFSCQLWYNCFHDILKIILFSCISIYHLLECCVMKFLIMPIRVLHYFLNYAFLSLIYHASFFNEDNSCSNSINTLFFAVLSHWWVLLFLTIGRHSCQFLFILLYCKN